MNLYHYSCAHTATLIEQDGLLRPSIPWRHYDTLMVCNGEPMSGLWRAPAVLWLTDLATPDRKALGLTAHSIECDRSQFRYTVERDEETGDTMPWLQFAEQHHANPEWLRILHKGRQPDRWFVTVLPQSYIECVDLRARAVA